MTTQDGPDETVLGSEPEKHCMQYVPALNECLNWFQVIWRPLEQELVQNGLLWQTLMMKIPPELKEYGELLRLRKAVLEELPKVVAAEINRRIYARNGVKLTDLQRQLQLVGGGGATEAEVVRQLRVAVREQNVETYSKAFDRLVSLHEKQEVLQYRRQLLTKLGQVAPTWADAIRRREGIHGYEMAPENFKDAWKWRQLHDELERRAGTSLEELQEQSALLSDTLHNVTADLVEKKAWLAQAGRTTSEQRRALNGWKTFMRKVGKGTGRRAPVC